MENLEIITLKTYATSIETPITSGYNTSKYPEKEKDKNMNTVVPQIDEPTYSEKDNNKPIISGTDYRISEFFEKLSTTTIDIYATDTGVMVTPVNNEVNYPEKEKDDTNTAAPEMVKPAYPEIDYKKPILPETDFDYWGLESFEKLLPTTQNIHVTDANVIMTSIKNDVKYPENKDDIGTTLENNYNYEIEVITPRMEDQSVIRTTEDAVFEKLLSHSEMGTDKPVYLDKDNGEGTHEMVPETDGPIYSKESSGEVFAFEPEYESLGTLATSSLPNFINAEGEICPNIRAKCKKQTRVTAKIITLDVSSYDDYEMINYLWTNNDLMIVIDLIRK